MNTWKRNCTDIIIEHQGNELGRINHTKSKFNALKVKTIYKLKFEFYENLSFLPFPLVLFS